jgi:hypothetical protein
LSRAVPALLFSYLIACSGQPAAPLSADVTYTEDRQPCGDRSALRHVYFGDLHYHTRWSWDAYGYELTVSPAEAYAFARSGAKVLLPPLDPATGKGTREAALERPLDFAAGTDHSEFYGELRACTTPGLPGHDSASCAAFRGLGEQQVVAWGTQLALPQGKPRQADICGDDGEACRSAARTVWDEIKAAAEAANDRTGSCSFAALIGYEYTASPNITNQHRNVIFRNAKVPELPITYYEQPTAVGLWKELARQCLDAGAGCQALVVPHNSNWSNGTLYADSYITEQARAAGLDEQQAIQLRTRLEGVAEFFQHKGDMECMPGLSSRPAWAADPQCSFEKERFAPFDDCGEGTGVGGVRDWGCVSRLDFLRGLLGQRLADEKRLGLQLPIGVIGSTDSHNGTPGNTDERTWPGHVGVADDTPEERLGPGNSTHRGLVNNPGGLAAIWAVERSRDAIFEALLRREVYATSGTRIAVRFFGGYSLPDSLCQASDRAEQGYRQGVPMGGRLAAPAGGDGQPRFLVEATADSGTAAHPGTPLQQVQIVKVWLDAGGAAQERVVVVAGDPQNGASVDESTCEQRGTGATSLCGVWRDVDYVPGQAAVYYARVLENPSCRWSTRLCNGIAAGQRPPGCSDPNVQKVIQERAITSAITVSP